MSRMHHTAHISWRGTSDTITTRSPRSSHPHVTTTRRKVRTPKACAAKPRAGLFQQSAFRHGGLCFGDLPRRVPHSKRPAPAMPMREAGVTFHQKLRKAPAFRRKKILISRFARGVISKLRAGGITHFPPCPPGFRFVVIACPPATVGQSKERPAKIEAERVRHPFRQEENAGFISMPHIRPDIQIGMSADGLHEPLGEWLRAHASQSPHREGDQTDKGPSLMEIERVRNRPLQEIRIHLKVQKRCAVPVRQQKRLASDGAHSRSGRRQAWG